MRILLGLRNTKLILSQVGNHFSQSIMNFFLFESHMLIRNRRIIVRKADKEYILPCPSIKETEIIITESMADFSCSIRAEVKENHCITVRNGMHCSIFFNHRRKYKFIIYLLRIRSINRFFYGRSLFSRAVHNSAIRLFHSVIILVSIHGIISSGNRRNLSYTKLLHLLFYSEKERFSGIGRRIPTV